MKCIQCRNANKPSKDKCRDCDEKFIIPGLGSKLLSRVLDDKNSASLLSKIQKNNLTPSQEKDWIRIGEVLFEWCCALKPAYV